MIISRQSTARTVTVGPVLDSTGVAVTDGVVGDFKISKNGGAPAALNGSATLTHRNTGHYSLALTASDLDTVGQAEIVIDDTTNACPIKEITVIEEVVYDAIYAASAAGYGTAQTGDSYAIVNSGTFGNSALKTLIDAVDNFIDTEIASIISTLGTPAGVSLAADLVVIDDFVDALETRLTAARAGYLDNINNANLATVPAFPTNFASLGINASGHVSRVTITDTTTTNTDMITAAGIRAAVGLAAANLDTQLGTIDDFLDTEVAGILAAVDTEIATIVTAVGTTLPAQISALLTTAMSESYRADGATGSVAQLLYEVMALLGEFSISGTTKQHKKIDGSSNAFASTLDSSTAPTAITRSLSA